MKELPVSVDQQLAALKAEGMNFRHWDLMETAEIHVYLASDEVPVRAEKP